MTGRRQPLEPGLGRPGPRGRCGPGRGRPPPRDSGRRSPAARASRSCPGPGAAARSGQPLELVPAVALLRGEPGAGAGRASRGEAALPAGQLGGVQREQMRHVALARPPPGARPAEPRARRRAASVPPGSSSACRAANWASSRNVSSSSSGIEGGPSSRGYRPARAPARSVGPVPAHDRAGDQVPQPLAPGMKGDEQQADQVGRGKKVGDPEQVAGGGGARS